MPHAQVRRGKFRRVCVVGYRSETFRGSKEEQVANLDFFSLYKNIIAIPSIKQHGSPLDQSNEAVIRLLADWFGQLGFQCEVTALPALPGKFNLVATIGQGEGGLLLAGHTDTVPFDEGAWRKDPFKVTEEGNRLYGLGTIDMKGFFAFIVEALKEIDLKTLNKPLRILATADEETTMAGARAIADAAELKTRLRERSQLGSRPTGVNALEIMHQAMGQVLKLQHSLKEKYADHRFAVAAADAEPRLHPGGRQPEPHLRLLRTAHRTCHLHEPIPAYACADDSELVREAERASGRTAESVNYCTEAPFIQQLGCETIVLGPGHIAQAHQPDEYLDLSFSSNRPPAYCST
ncbi:UNVERIFIED_CONTAM: hypothetical protein K2H54_000137 [Gekko kuhli]